MCVLILKWKERESLSCNGPDLPICTIGIISSCFRNSFLLSWFIPSWNKSFFRLRKTCNEKFRFHLLFLWLSFALARAHNLNVSSVFSVGISTRSRSIKVFRISSWVCWILALRIKVVCALNAALMSVSASDWRIFPKQTQFVIQLSLNLLPRTHLYFVKISLIWPVRQKIGCDSKWKNRRKWWTWSEKNKRFWFLKIVWKRDNCIQNKITKRNICVGEGGGCWWVCGNGGESSELVVLRNIFRQF